MKLLASLEGTQVPAASDTSLNHNWHNSSPVCPVFLSLAFLAAVLLWKARAQPYGQKWTKKSEKMMKETGIEASSAWQKQCKLKGVPKTPRCLSLLDMAKASLPDACHIVVDLSQSVQWRPWTDNCVRSVTTGSMYYSFLRDRTLTHREMWQLFGFPQRAIPDLSPGLSRDLLGQSMALPTVALPQAAILKQLYAAAAVAE